MYRLFILLLLFAPVITYGGEGQWFTVTGVINGKSFAVDSNDVVRLTSIEVPNTQEQDTAGHHGRPGEPLGEEAKQALSSLIMSRKIRIDYNPGKRDRHNRFLGQVYDEKAVWIQGEMLKCGFAEAYIFNDDSHELIEKMLVAEKEARDAKKGIWGNPYYRVIAPEEAGEFINRYRLVEGRVVSVNEYHENIYINFSEHWKGNFAIFISHKNAEAFSSFPVKSLEGKKIRVRGWINYHNAPMIDITRPEQIEME